MADINWYNDPDEEPKGYGFNVRYPNRVCLGNTKTLPNGRLPDELYQWLADNCKGKWGFFFEDVRRHAPFAIPAKYLYITFEIDKDAFAYGMSECGRKYTT